MVINITDLKQAMEVTSIYSDFSKKKEREREHGGKPVYLEPML